MTLTKNGVTYDIPDKDDKPDIERLAEILEGRMIDLTPIFQAVIAVVAVLITGYLIPYLKNKLTAGEQTSLQRQSRPL